MKFPKAVWLKLSQDEIEESMNWTIYPKTTDENRIIEVIINRIEFAERRATTKALNILLHAEGLELV